MVRSVLAVLAGYLAMAVGVMALDALPGALIGGNIRSRRGRPAPTG